jgi:hypothetical protein
MAIYMIIVVGNTIKKEHKSSLIVLEQGTCTSGHLISSHVVLKVRYRSWHGNILPSINLILTAGVCR